ncbi:MAG TPA: lipase maturation factor family protein [Bryobacteraceae bacterium]|nr:lipase maturation factor family protein [Bryobacteraceae bacterium]
MPDDAPALAKPLLLWDGKCGFCKIWVHYFKQLTGDRIDYATSQQRGAEFPQIPPADFGKSVQLVQPDGSVVSGGRVFFEITGHQRIYQASRPFRWITETAYKFIATHRNLFYHVTRFTFGTRIEPARFGATQWIFLRVLAVIYALAFASLAVQITGLIGQRGILPLPQFFESIAQNFGSVRYLAVPSIFWWNASDGALTGICWAGVALAAALLIGRLERLILILLWVLYLSLCSAGQDFLGFQWDALLLETGFLAIFLGRSKTVVWLFRWLVFRVFFLSGAVKLLSHDPTWRDFTALRYHFHTQPLPTVFAWFADHLPDWFLRLSTQGMFFIELVAPFLIYLPRRLRMLGASLLITLEVLIAITGNYGYFNLLTIALCLFLFDDRVFSFKRFPRRDVTVPSRPECAVSILLAIFILTLGLTRMFETFRGAPAPEPLRTLARYTAPLQIVNPYGLFAVMTTTRPEIILEGSRDGETWQAYEFPYKPGALNRAPRWAAPYQPRLDWQMWFAALGNVQSNPWFASLAVRLLEGSPEVGALLASNPFGDRPPRYIRATIFEYSFTDGATRARTGEWWKREPRGQYLPPVGLRSQIQPAAF